MTISNISFEGDNELKRDLAIGKFCQALIKFTNLDTLELINVNNIHSVIKFITAT